MPVWHFLPPAGPRAICRATRKKADAGRRLGGWIGSEKKWKYGLGDRAPGRIANHESQGPLRRRVDVQNIDKSIPLVGAGPSRRS